MGIDEPGEHNSSAGVDGAMIFGDRDRPLELALGAYPQDGVSRCGNSAVAHSPDLCLRGVVVFGSDHRDELPDVSNDEIGFQHAPISFLCSLGKAHEPTMRNLTTHSLMVRSATLVMVCTRGGPTMKTLQLLVELVLCFSVAIAPGCSAPDDGDDGEVACDDGLDNDGDGLPDCEDPDCEEMTGCEAVCGNGEVDPGEACDLGDENGDSSCCASDCQLRPAGEVCRAGSGDDCDPDENCDGESGVCPEDVLSDSSVVCREGSGDICDPDETCTGVAGEACPEDFVSVEDTLCREGSGDICDPDEVCSGVAGEACPPEVITTDDTVCRAGSGDACDPDEVCSGVSGEACPEDVLAEADMVCREGSGDACDPDEMCPGVAGAACPDDVVGDAETVCRAGSGDLCDLPEMCSGVAGSTCPVDVVADAGTTCRAGSGDVCDPDEVCTGVAGEACPADDVASPIVVCRVGSGDACDPDEVCSGTAGEPCPADELAAGGTVCRVGSGDNCDPDEECTGVSGEACPGDAVAEAGMVCRVGSGDLCDFEEECSGVAGEACPEDVVAEAGTICRMGSGDMCDPAEECTGVAGEACPDDEMEEEGTLCRGGSGDECDPDEVCTGGAGESCPADVSLDDGRSCDGNGESECSGADFCLDGVCENYDMDLGFPCGDGVEQPTCDPDSCDGDGSCVSREVLEDGELCDDDEGDTCCGGLCVTGSPEVGTCDPCVLPEIPAVHVSITTWSNAETWRALAVGLGMTATIEPASIMDSIDSLGATDILIVADPYSITPAQTNVVRQFVEGGGGVYLGGEWRIHYAGNVAFASIVNALGGEFTWVGSVEGDLSPLPILGCLGQHPAELAPLPYFWYGAEGTGEGWDAFMEWGGRPVGYRFCSPGAGEGLVFHTTDNDWINRGAAEHRALQSNILARLAFASDCI